MKKIRYLPFGYTIRNGQTVIDQQEAETVRGIFTAYIHGASLKEIERCACGKYGCVEQYASAKGLIRITRKLLEKKDPYTVLVDTPELSAKQILDAAKRGDRLALDAVEVLGKALGSALAAVAEVIDPEVFVIGGGIAGAGEIILRIVQKYYRPDVLPAGADIPFELARLGNDAGMYGSMKLLLDSSDEK